MKILVCGGRDFEDRDFVFDSLDQLMFEQDCWDSCIIIQGGAKGADALAKEWAYERVQACAQVDAPWEMVGKVAGRVRNGWMLRLKPDVVIAFPGGKGTSNMITQAEEAGVPVERFVPGCRNYDVQQGEPL